MMPGRKSVRARMFLIVAAACAVVAPLRAQTQGSSQQGPAPAVTPPPADQTQSQDSDATPTMFPHSESAPWWVSGQINFITQWHPAFRSSYQGPHSQTPLATHGTSRVLTLFLGYALTHTTEV